MAAISGRFSLGPESGRLLVRTGRSGFGRRAGHDLTIEVTRWSGTAVVDADEPERSWVTVEAEVDSFEVREGVGGARPLTDGDRAQIREILRGRVLHAPEYPLITFRSIGVRGAPEEFAVDGELTILGGTRPIIVHGRIAGDRAQGTATVLQSRWGVLPYSAFFGALKLADEVRVAFDLRLGGAG